VLAARADDTPANREHTTRTKYCFEMKDKYNIVPGASFGDLPNKLHNEYLEARCFQFFCEPNVMGGKGKFTCIPLPGIVISK
jgi:hypothetical protein